MTLHARGVTLIPKRHGFTQPRDSEVTTMRNGLIGLVVGGALVLVACSGSGTTGSAAATAEAPAAQSRPPADGGTSTEPSAATQASTEPSVAAAPVTEAPAGGGGGAAGVCELVTGEELAGIFGVTSVDQTVLAGPPDNCIVESDTGDPLTAWSLTTAQAAALYDAFTVDPSTVEVPGVGDKAAIVQNTGLMVLKGNSLLVVNISGGANMSEVEVLEATKQIAVLAAGRL